MNKQQFKQRRKELNLSTRQLANELGLSPKNGDVYIRKIESGASEPSGLLIRCFELLYYKLKLENNDSQK